MPKTSWQHSDYELLLVIGTDSLFLLILVGCVVLGVLMNKITPELLGSVKGAAVGTGLLGFAILIQQILVRGLRR